MEEDTISAVGKFLNVHQSSQVTVCGQRSTVKLHWNTQDTKLGHPTIKEPLGERLEWYCTVFNISF